MDPVDGVRVCEEAAIALKEGGRAYLDFAGVTTLTTSFLNAALGCLYGRFEPKYVDERLSCQGLDASDEALVRLVRENAIQFYQASEHDRQTISEAARHAVETC